MNMDIRFYRGTHEIGGTCVELTTKTTRIIIDMGLPFKLESGEDAPPLEEIYSLTQEELLRTGIAKDVPGLYYWDKKNKPPDAILITHPHPDHFGLLPFVNPAIPLYMSLGTKLMIGDVSNLFNKVDQDLKDVHMLDAWKPFDIGDITITPFLADHAGFDARGFLIEGEGKKLFYTGDFRGHGKKSVVFENFLKHPPSDVEYLIAEGTHIESGDYPYKNEKDVEDAMVEKMKETKGLVFINFSSQNIDRIVAIYNACVRAGRIFVIDPYTAHVLKVARKLSEKIPDTHFDPCNIFRIFDAHGKHSKILKDADLYYGFPARAYIDCDGIREKLGQIAVRDIYFIRKQFKKNGLLDGASFIYSQWEGYLEKEGSEKSYWNELGIEIKQIHVSGHATLEELKRVVTALNPKHIIPFHTPDPDTFRGHFGDRVRVLSDGERITL